MEIFSKSSVFAERRELLAKGVVIGWEFKLQLVFRLESKLLACFRSEFSL